MSMDDRIEVLKTRHSELEEAIEKENSHPFPDDIEIAGLKKQKLRIKDQLAALVPG